MDKFILFLLSVLIGAATFCFLMILRAMFTFAFFQAHAIEFGVSLVVTLLAFVILVDANQ